MIRWHVISAIFKRNVASYFSGVLGYLFIVVFVVASGALAFNERFFTANEPNLDQLSEWFPLLLLFIIPAITMSCWSDEKKLGTDELLFTLPASDLEILLGKYLAVFAVYTVTLLFSTTHVIVLSSLGNPDYGALATTYFGYWIAGGTLISAGMLASAMTSSTTVAFVLGVVICGIPVFVGYLGNLFGWRDFFDALSFREQFRDFGLGMVPLSGLLYFVSLTVFMLYLNYVLISRRHWKSSKQKDMGLQFSARAISLAVALVCVCALATYGVSFRLDRTAEKLYTLSSATRTIIADVDEKAPVLIQAYVSPEVPRDYVATRKQLLGKLRQYDQLGGKLVEVRYVSVTPYSEEAEEARLAGIEPVTVISDRDGRQTREQVFLGAVVGSSFDEVTIPFFGRGLPLEYELTRSLQTVSRSERLTVGILNTDANVMTGSGEWEIVTELRKQYKIVEVSPGAKINGDNFDVLLAVLPSSLTAPEMVNFTDYVRSGRPTLIFDDPCPLMFSSQFGISNAPRLPKPSPGGGGMMGMQQPPEQKADGGKATSLMRLLGCDWDNGRTIFEQQNPHPQFGMLPQEYVFITSSNGNSEAFSSKSGITSGLQEVVAIYPGEIISTGRLQDVEFIPLLQTGGNSGKLAWEDYINESFNPFAMQSTAQLKGNVFRQPDKYAHVLAAHINSSKGDGLNVVYVADIDMIADLFFTDWNRGEIGVKFDNVTFVLNAVDVLAGEDAFLDLRKRRKKHRSLTTVEGENKQFLKQVTDAEKAADDKMENELKRVREQLNDQIKVVEEDQSLDPRAKQIRVEQIRALLQRRLDVAQENLERKKEAEIEESRIKAERSMAAIKNEKRVKAVVLPALPPIFIGLLVLGLKLNAERQTITPSRKRSRS